MKKYSPYILPLFVVGVVFILFYRWYSMRTERMTSGLLDEGVIIENLSQEEIQETLSEANDYKSIELKPVETENNSENSSDNLDNVGKAIIKYDFQDNKLVFSVEGTFPEAGESYQVFLREIDGQVTRYAFTLEDKKGGLIGSAAISADILPIEVIVAKGGTDKPGDIVLSGKIEAPGQE